MATAALIGALFVACGDTEGNVIERAAHSRDAGPGCTTPGGCSETGVQPVGECSSNTDCTDPSKRLCNVISHTCAECLVDRDCIDRTETCSYALNRCAVPCSSDADCGPDDPVCDLAVGRAGTPGFCVGCRAVTDCTNPAQPFCVEGDCVACESGQC
jgi:hypothetical protein